jgi:RNA-directed DNA polymerase
MYDRRTRAHLARFLADAFLSGVWNDRALADRAARALDHRPRWLRPVAGEVLAAYDRPPLDRPRELARLIERRLAGASPDFEPPDPPRIRRWLVPESEMGRRRWPVPELASRGALAEMLGLSYGELLWLADARGLERTVMDQRLRNYRYLALPRDRGPIRVIEHPKRRLKAIQRRLLHEILDWIPAHDAAHGFTRGRSAISHAESHTGQLVVIRLDLEDFFASVAARRVFGIFRAAGYPEAVAHSLTGLTTNAIPVTVWPELKRCDRSGRVDLVHRLGRRLAAPHLPQGAPTSPALASLAAFGLDRRLSGLAAAFDATYTRYADDLTFSGTARLLRSANRFRAAVATISADEGFAINQRKSMLATRAGRQQVCGIVVNEHLNVPRTEYDILRAILQNACRHGPHSQNRAGVPDFRAHLLGRIAWVASLHPQRGERLRHQFAQIAWDTPAAPVRDTGLPRD